MFFSRVTFRILFLKVSGTEEVDNLQAMINEILDTMRLETDLLVIEPQPLRLLRLAQ